MPRESNGQLKHMIHGGGPYQKDFLQAIQSYGSQLDFTFLPQKRSTETVVAQLSKHKEAIEVTAKAMGQGLHINVEMITTHSGGALAGIGLFGEINQVREWKRGRKGNQRDTEAKLDGFQEYVLEPAIRDITTKAQGGAAGNSGFLGA